MRFVFYESLMAYLACVETTRNPVGDASRHLYHLHCSGMLRKGAANLPICEPR